MNHIIWGISDFFSLLWRIFIILCKTYLSIGFIVVLIFLLFMVLSYILVHDEFIESTTELMKEFNLDNSILSFVVFFLILSVFILFTYPIVITGIFKSDDWYGELIMSIRDKLNKVSNKIDLFPELSFRDKFINRLIVFGINIFNWTKSILLKLYRI